MHESSDYSLTSFFYYCVYLIDLLILQDYPDLAVDSVLALIQNMTPQQRNETIRAISKLEGTQVILETSSSKNSSSERSSEDDKN